MKKLAVLLIMLLVPSVLHAAASSETGDTRAEPISLYGKQSDGTVTALQVDSDGKLVISGGGSGDSVWTAGDTTVSLDTTNSGKTVVMDADATVATDMSIGNNLSVGNAISAGSLEVAGVSAGSLTVGDEIILTPANTVQVNGDLTTSGFIGQDSTFIDLPLDFDLSRSNGIGSTIEYLYGSFTPYNFNVETATLFIDLTPSGDLTVAIYEGSADVTTPDVDISATKVGTAHTVNNLFESGNFLGVKLTGVSDSTDLTNTGVLRLLGERRSES